MSAERNGPAFERLPKWAQRDIETLEMRVREAQAAARQRHENAPTHIVVEQWSENKAYLKDSDHVTFLLENEEYLDVRFSYDDKGNRNGIEVHGSGYALPYLAFLPSSSNVGRLRLLR